MDWSLRTLLKFATALSWLAVSGKAAHAYPQPVDFDGSLMRWDIGPDSDAITIDVEADRDQDLTLYAGAVADAAQLWSEVPGSFFQFQALPDGETGQVTVHLQSTLEGSDYSAGYAIFDEYSGKTPTHCSVYVVVDQTATYDGLAKTLLHELGHCAGLGHTLIPEAIMSYSLDQNSFALDIDDEAAITRLYPLDGSKPHLPPGCAVGAVPEGRGEASVLLLALAAIGPLAFRRPAFSRSRASGRSKPSP